MYVQYNAHVSGYLIFLGWSLKAQLNGCPNLQWRPARFPDFIYHGGPVINTPQVYILFVGDWSSAANKTQALRLSQFVSDFLNSSYMNILSQYGCGRTGKVRDSVFVPTPNNNLSGIDIHSILQTGDLGAGHCRGERVWPKLISTIDGDPDNC
jgi:hypothetical protein